MLWSLFLFELTKSSKGGIQLKDDRQISILCRVIIHISIYYSKEQFHYGIKSIKKVFGNFL